MSGENFRHVQAQALAAAQVAATEIGKPFVVHIIEFQGIHAPGTAIYVQAFYEDSPRVAGMRRSYSTIVNPEKTT